jgi:hypothetical protein
LLHFAVAHGRLNVRHNAEQTIRVVHGAQLMKAIRTGSPITDQC